MQNFQKTSNETSKRSFISVIPIFMTVPLKVSPNLLLKMTVNYCYRICIILCMIFKKRLFIEALCRSLFRKYAHCKPLFLFQNNA